MKGSSAIIFVLNCFKKNELQLCKVMMQLPRSRKQRMVEKLLGI
jgi:hypothetical protein